MGDFSLVYVLRGQGKYIDHRGKCFCLTNGSFFMRFPGLKHTNVIEPGVNWQELFLAFGPQLCKAMIDMAFIDPEKPVGFVGNQPAVIIEAWELIKRMQKADPSETPYIYKSMSAILMEILAMNSLGEKKHASTMMIEQVSDYIADHLHERITIDVISHRFGISNAKLRKDFKQIKGISIGSYLIKKRIETSFRYLNDPDISIGEIADRMGYKNTYDFSNQFKKFIGYPPSWYRKNII
jgi:AraC family transcriptional regulator, arabinose operon regulatory protein